MVLVKDIAKAIKALTLGGLAFSLLPAPSPVQAPIQRLEAQAFPGRLRRPPPPGPDTAPPLPAAPQPAALPAASAPPPAQPAAALPPSMLQQPAQPATIQFSAQSLSIHADNSSLRDILHQLSQQTGMDVQGLGDDERVFGSFGPGKPQDVVSDLLNGTPYDVLMVGVLDNGAPRQLVLSAASHVAASAAPSAPPPPAKDDSDDAANNDTTNAPPAGPVQTPSPGSEPPATGLGVKTPQQLFQQLQQMREQQQQQQGQPQQPPPQPQAQQQQPTPQQ